MNATSKFERIQEELKFLAAGDVVLSIGCSAEFLSFAKDISGKIFAIELEQFRNRFKKIKNRKITMTFGNVFELAPLRITKANYVDLLVNDLKLNFMRSLRALNRMLPVLKDNGKLLMFVKVDGEKEVAKKVARKFLENSGLSGIKFSEYKNELYVFALKKKEELLDVFILK